MAGQCKYERNGNVWILVQKCPSQKPVCPTVPNFKPEADSSVPLNPAGESAFLTNFRNALQSADYPNATAFTFLNDDEIILNCDSSAGHALTYLRNGNVLKLNGNDLKFKLTPGAVPGVQLV